MIEILRYSYLAVSIGGMTLCTWSIYCEMFPDED